MVEKNCQNEKRPNTSEITDILLLLPVPKSIIMCLLLWKWVKGFPAAQNEPDLPIEKHDRARIVQLIHLPQPVNDGTHTVTKYLPY